jgi:hypothetical protein
MPILIAIAAAADAMALSLDDAVPRDVLPRIIPTIGATRGRAGTRG